jgi:hypothetical protein
MRHQFYEYLVETIEKANRQLSIFRYALSKKPAVFGALDDTFTGSMFFENDKMQEIRQTVSRIEDNLNEIKGKLGLRSDV